MPAPGRGGLTVGVLGGMGPAATVDFLARVVTATPARNDQDHLHLLVDLEPRVPDRTEALLRGGPDPTPVLCAMARRLAAMGADLLVMPCNSAVPFAASVAASVPVPLLRWEELLASSLARRVAPGALLGLVATEGTLGAGLHERALQAEGLVVLRPEPAVQRQVTRIIRDRKAGRPPASLAASLDEVCAALRRRGAATVVTACTDLSDIVRHLRSEVLDSAQLVAEALVGIALGRPGDQVSPVTTPIASPS